jgi:hypothetical protein
MREAGNPLDRARWLDPLEMLLHAPETPAPYELGAVWRGEFSHAEIGALLRLAGIEEARDFARQMLPYLADERDETARLRGRLRLRLCELRILIHAANARADDARAVLRAGATPLKFAQKGTKGVVIKSLGRPLSVAQICAASDDLRWVFSVPALRFELLRLRALEAGGDYTEVAVSVSSFTLGALLALDAGSF